ncbi:hypothetical protein RGF97_20840 [Streptomyces roseicoloratus]|uniref:Uncharacterized protein n=1 Tax=Streptomyces roseicoloratus TaxID=2508722 RepID=A0ABY9RYH6_9ACTN|nr:hypothetical protein [Streptomyces roseicoloratus]WMX46778.1 hypothetical protein RGF97_20840 [Streptomyces roseicoloratus]
MLEALGHSPEAAKEFFSKAPTSYKEDGTPGGDYSLGTDEKGGFKTYLSVFTDEKYESFPDTDGRGPEEAAKTKDFLPDALGHALEAATLGHAWDDPHPKLVRDETTAGIMQEVVGVYGDATFLKEHHSALADSLGTMAAGYIDDLNWAVGDGNVAQSVFAPRGDVGERGAHALLRPDDAVAFLSTLGQHPDSYATVSVAEQAYLTSVLEREAQEHGGRIDAGRVDAAVSTGAAIHGLVDRARADQITAESLKTQEDFEKAQEARGAWIEFGTTAAIAAGVAFLPATAAAAGAAAIVVPLAVDTGSGAMETLAGRLVAESSDETADEHKGDLEEQARQARAAVFARGREASLTPLNQFLMYHQGELSNEEVQNIVNARRNAYNDGGLTQGRQGTLPQTGGEDE